MDHLFRSGITLNDYLTVFCIISLDFYVKPVLITLIFVNCALGSDWILLMVAKYFRSLIKPTCNYSNSFCTHSSFTELSRKHPEEKLK